MHGKDRNVDGRVRRRYRGNKGNASIKDINPSY